MAESIVTDVVPRARRMLSASPHHVVRALRVDLSPDGLVISGSVPSFYFKQLAQEALRALAEDVSIVNSVRVRYRLPREFPAELS